ncbi:MAG: tRNA (adenosine(37)-N6)-dimethylallyltransferase MiaA [Candidatus Mcinerneyibacterium aminivorans]|uniref:tRNA dimethylallyltransferase n=1 Tax=Candidatus Mcinerneyibacterium aminivorans TaxID=2703815 RepID=A0A5D0MCK9_9BACT|nr:MAG: tRNA (adenosine(37)-N6)-dimethylallyltransferase MiaA [Candidatus Mcinerneyibacterium aminivorans]
MLDFIIISGPTAVGKTKFVNDLSSKLNAEIISADSQAVYKYLDIGTAKPKKSQRDKYHLINLVEPDEIYDVSNFIEDADKKITELKNRGKKVIICGGTPMYINKLIYGLDDMPGRNPEIRRKLDKAVEKNGREHLYNKLQKIDPKSAEKIHPNDLYRVKRALEIYYVSGKTRTQWHSKEKKSRYNYLYYIFSRNRENLYNRINKRVEKMIEKGLINEVEDLVKNKGFNGNEKGFKAIGYEEVVDFLENKISRQEMIRLIKRNTRHFAKRQLIWYRKEEDTIELNLDTEGYNEIFSKILTDIKEKGGLK